MATNNKIAEEVVKKLETCLKELQIKSETKSTVDEAIIYGKFSLDKSKHRIVIHLQKEDFKPVTADYSQLTPNKTEKEDCAQTPNLNFQSSHSSSRKYSEEEGLKIKREFLEEAYKLLPKLKR